MKIELVCTAVIFSTMIFTPLLTLEKEVEPLTPPISESSTFTEYSEPTVSVLNIYDGSVFDVPMEEYLLGVVLAEMPASFEADALKAQSVAARTYTKGKLDSPAHDNADICMAASCCQAYIYPSLYEGGENNLKKVKNAVDETRGEIMTYNSEPVLAVFHSMSAGKTEDAENVWGSSVPYLKSAESEGEKVLEKFETTYAISFLEFAKKINSAAADALFTSPEEIDPPLLSQAGYVKSIKIGNRTFTGSEIRSIFSLRSASFSIKADQSLVTFTVKGYGHGVGMSQHGANEMAKDGKMYDEILKHYYKGVEIETIR